MSWFALCLLSVTSLATAELLQQHLLNAKNELEEKTSAALTYLIQATLTIPFILFTDLRYSFFSIFSYKTLPFFLAVTSIGALGFIFLFRSFKVKNISISTIFISFSTVVSTILGIIFFSEGFYFYKILGISLVLIAIISLNIENFHLEKNHYYGLLAGVMFGIVYVLDKRMVMSVEPINYIFWCFLVSSFFGFLLGGKTVIKVLQKSKLGDFKPVLFSGIGYFLYNFLTFKAYTVGGEVGRIDAINNSEVFLIILFEYFLLKHKDDLVRKLLTAGIAFTGVVILGLL